MKIFRHQISVLAVVRQTIYNVGTVANNVNGKTIQPGEIFEQEVEYEGFDTGSFPDHIPENDIVVTCR